VSIATRGRVTVMPAARPASKDDIACPFCAEKIDRDATRCHWCRREVAGLTPTHGGRCPACLQEIKDAALLCRHCGASFVSIQAIIGRSLSAEQQLPCVGCGSGTAGIYAKSVRPVVAGAAAQPSGHAVSIPLAQLLTERSLSRTTSMAAPDKPGGGGGGSTCHWFIRLVPCTLCFPGTNWCWEDTCLEIGLDCSGEF
jgi:DNA-directed RNA polymerase subunit RPC12/RpoP